MRKSTFALFLVISSFGCAPNAQDEEPSLTAAATIDPAHRTQRYSVELLPPLAGNTSVHKINDRGQVIGIGFTAGGELHALFWEHGSVTDVGTLGGITSDSADLNDRGQVTGVSSLADGSQHGFIWQGGVIRDLGTFGGNSYAEAINDRGQIVGNSITTTGDAHAFIWSSGVMTDLGTLGGSYSVALDINDRGDVAGDAETTSGERHSFLWHEGVMRDLGTLGGGLSTSVAINEHGEVTGWSRTAASALHAYLWTRGHMLDLGAVGSGDSFPHAINDWGQVVGDSQASADYAVAWERHSLIQVATGVAATLADINDDGTAVGSDGPKRAIAWSRHDGIAELPLVVSTDINSAWSINRRGWIVGDEDDGKGSERAVMWKPTHCGREGD